MFSNRTSSRSWRVVNAARALLVLLGACGGVAGADGFSTLHEFRSGSGQNPTAGLVEGSDGALYGVTYQGGPTNQGTVYRVTRDGTHTVLHHFSGASADGWGPQGALVEGSDGALYGTTHYGGISGHGTVYRIQKDGSGFALLHSFHGSTEGYHPYGLLIESREDGVLCGTTSGGGDGGGGTIFKLRKDGSGFAILHVFRGGLNDGAEPHSGVVEGADGALYGTTYRGGSADEGTVFRLEKNGSGFAVLHSFVRGGSDGYNPRTGLIEGSDGLLHGTTSEGGSTFRGTIYQLAKDGTGYAVVHSFGSSAGDGISPQSGLVEGNDGFLYGSTTYAATASGPRIFRIGKDGTGYQIVYAFALDGSGGWYPYGALIQHTEDGMLYGTAYQGGAGRVGTVFRVAPGGTDFAVLHAFDSGLGKTPGQGALTQDTDGALYGTTQAGGTANSGTVYRLSRDGTGHTVLHSFGTVVADGQNPEVVIVGSDGLLYGTTSGGGAKNGGTIFRLATDGSTFQTLHSFDPQTGYGPSALLEGSDGNLYGTTQYGISSTRGSVFRLGKDGSGFAVLHAFLTTNSDGIYPDTLMEGGDGLLYGTAQTGGGTGYRGTVYQVGKDGTAFVVLHRFQGGTTDGAGPVALVEGNDGILYGATGGGGTYGEGTVFRLAKDGTFEVLHSFWRYSTDGAGFSLGPLVVGRSDGRLYGITHNISWNACTIQHCSGTLFRLATDGTGFRVLHYFAQRATSSYATMIEAIDGSLLGTKAWTQPGAVFTDILFEFSRPIANPGADQEISLGDAALLHGSGASSKPILSYQWTVTSHPPGGTWSLSGANSADASFTPSMVGEYTLALVVANEDMPSIPAPVTVHVRPADAIPPTSTHTLNPAPNAAGWNGGSVDVTISATDQGGSGVAEIRYRIGTGSEVVVPGATASFQLGTEGVTTFWYRAVDAAGNVEAEHTGVVRIDKTAPLITIGSCPSTILLGTLGASATVDVSDALSGVHTQSIPNGPVLLDASTVGPKAVSVTAVDLAGNTASAACIYHVVYDFDGAGGFYLPLENSPAVNVANAGQAVPVKWMLPDGLGGYFCDLNLVMGLSYKEVVCESLGSDYSEVSAPTAGNSGLACSEGQYQFNWKSSKDMAGRCFQFVLSLDDGSAHAVNFAFK